MIFDAQDKKCNECRWLDHSSKCINPCSEHHDKDIKDLPVRGCEHSYPYDEDKIIPVRCNHTPMLEKLKL